MGTVSVGTRGSSLPRFLKPCQPQRSAIHVAVPVHAVYTHKHPFGDAQVLWWPAGRQAHDGEVAPGTILLFIPGTSALSSGHCQRRPPCRRKSGLFLIWPPGRRHRPPLRKPGPPRLLRAVSERDRSRCARYCGAFVVVVVVRGDLRACSSRLVVLRPRRRLIVVRLPRDVQRGTFCPGRGAPRVPR